MSNTTWKRSGSIHQVRRRVFCWCFFSFVRCDDDDDWPLSFWYKESSHVFNGVSFFLYRHHHHHHLGGCWRRPPTKRAQKLILCPFLSRLSLSRHRILENVVRRTRRQNVVAVRLRRLVQERVGPTGHRRRRYRFHVRRQLELVLGGKVRTRVPRNE